MNIMSLVSNKISSAIIFMLGMSGIIFGWLIVGIELYHLSLHYHQFEAMPFIVGGISMTAGGVIVQTGSIMNVVQFLMDLKPGGRRKNDPPAND